MHFSVIMRVTGILLMLFSITLALPVMTRGAATPDGGLTARDRWARRGHHLAACAMAASFVVEWRGSVGGGYLLRALLAWGLLLGAGELWRPPGRSGWNRWLIWWAGWLTPAGLALVVLWPAQRVAALHLTFIGGFALLALGVATQVSLGHQGYEQLKNGRPWPLALLVLGLAGALAARLALAGADERFYLYLGVAAASLLAGVAVWAGFLLPKLWRPFGS